MPDTIESVLEWIFSPLNDFFNWYGIQLLNFPLSFLSYVISLFLFGIFLQFLIDTFRFLRGIVNMLFFPLRIIHIWFHVRETKRMVEKRLHSENKLDSYLLRPRLYISLAISSQDDYSRIGLGGNMTVKEAWKIASAPTYGSLFMLVVLTFLTPFLRTGLLGMLIHLYLFAGTALVLVPSSSDYHAVVHAVIIQSNVHPFYYLWSTAVFATGFSVSMSVDFNALTSLITGVMLTLVYFFLLITVTVFLDPRFDQLNIIEDDFGRDMKTLEQQLNEQQFFLME